MRRNILILLLFTGISAYAQQGQPVKSVGPDLHRSVERNVKTVNADSTKKRSTTPISNSPKQIAPAPTFKAKKATHQ